MTKIGIIGAGSAVFSLNLIKDICLCKNLKDSKICLMDINEERLDNIYQLCVRYAEETGNVLHIEKTTDRETCIREADFVINVALDYGHQRLTDGWRIAYKNGYRFGGSLHIVHDEAFWVNFYQLRLMESIAEDVLRISPNAWLVMVANPVLAGITYLSRKYPKLKVVGMCHGYAGVDRLSKALGLNPEEVTYEVSGVNHFIWLTSFRYQGKDAFPILDQWIENGGAEEYWKTSPLSDEVGPKAVDLYRKYGVFPIGDTCTTGGGAWGWWYHTPDVEEAWKENPGDWYTRYFGWGKDHIRIIDEAVHNRDVKVTEMIPSISSNEPMIPLIEALACDTERKVIVNIPNDRGYVKGVPQDFEVEIPAMISRRGIQGIKALDLPKPILSYIYRDRIAPVELELEAYQTGNLDYLMALIIMDPWTKSEEQAKKLLDDIFAMPCNREMKEYFEKGKRTR